VSTIAVATKILTVNSRVTELDVYCTDERKETVMDIVAALDEARASVDVLEHPFYVRWNAGELTEPELALYAGQYAHAVGALADAAAKAVECAPPKMRGELERHADEEAAHIDLWREFAIAAGADADDPEPPLPQTRDCVDAWTAGRDLPEHLAVLYVLEAGQPEISRTKLHGLTEHYGFRCDAPGTEYFRTHQTLDVEHSRQNADLICEVAPGQPDGAALQDRLVALADAALRGNWALLDGIQASSVHSGA
jgi:pyrroloquinoline-quinone synthase